MGPEDIELGETVKVKTKRPSRIVVSLRVPQEIIDELHRVAEHEDIYISQLVKRAIKAYLKNRRADG